MSAEIVHVNDDTFEAEVLKAEGPVLVDFWAEWCQPCKAIAPLLDQLAEEYAGKLKVVKVNVEDAQGTQQAYRVIGIPTLIMFNNGERLAAQSGAVGKPQLTAFVEANL